MRKLSPHQRRQIRLDRAHERRRAKKKRRANRREKFDRDLGREHRP